METLSIERVGGQGDGVAQTPAGPVFASLTLPGEVVRARVIDGRAEEIEIVSPSPERVAPVSPQYGDCGGCSLQHWASGPYLEWKREQVRLAGNAVTPPAARDLVGLVVETVTGETLQPTA